MTHRAALLDDAAASAAASARAQVWLWWRDFDPRAALLERW
jgi:hypothetical protein